MNTPPDGPGGERCPCYCLDRPRLTRMRSFFCPEPRYREYGAPPTEASSDARKKRLRRKAAYRARRSTDDAFREEPSASAPANERNNHATRRAPKRQKARGANYHRPFVAVIDSKARIISAETFSMAAYGIHGTTLICGVRRQTTAGRRSG